MTIQLSFTDFQSIFVLRNNEKVYGRIYNTQNRQHLLALVELSPNLNTTQVVKFAPTDKIIVQTFKCTNDNVQTQSQSLSRFQCYWFYFSQNLRSNQLQIQGKRYVKQVDLPIVNNDTQNKNEQSLKCKLFYNKFKKFCGKIPQTICNITFDLTIHEDQSVKQDKLKQSNNSQNQLLFYKGACKSVNLFSILDKSYPGRKASDFHIIEPKYLQE